MITKFELCRCPDRSPPSHPTVAYLCLRCQGAVITDGASLDMVERVFDSSDVLPSGTPVSKFEADSFAAGYEAAIAINKKMLAGALKIPLRQLSPTRDLTPIFKAWRDWNLATAEGQLVANILADAADPRCGCGESAKWFTRERYKVTGWCDGCCPRNAEPLDDPAGPEADEPIEVQS